ncbi:prefoldin [Gossypium australe]|uniref:Prefoldin n=1 Tax=Gossypium australe TaxID=47621 RepID=A0A5B6X0C6_9ROSI|nr:prefoldin [Gossypium australe]
MASTSSATASSDPELDLIKQIRTHEVAIAELGSISSFRTVYQKNGHLFFRTSIQKATSSEEKQLDQAKAKLEKLNSQ